jgi:hypothetical protein
MHYITLVFAFLIATLSKPLEYLSHKSNDKTFAVAVQLIFTSPVLFLPGFSWCICLARGNVFAPDHSLSVGI